MRSRVMAILVMVVVLAVAGVGVLYAATNGTLDPPAPPGSTSSYTLEQIYQRLTTGNYFAKQSGFTEPASGPTAGTMHTLDEIMAQAQPRALAKRVAKTGQTQCWNASGVLIGCANTGQDGEYQAGVGDYVVTPTCCGTTNAYNTPAWTGVRFTDNGDGTVTDNLTALIWLKDANCFGRQNWANALSHANTLNSGECGLTDGSTEGAWRLPNVNELHSLGPTWPPGAPFSDVQSDSHWSSTSGAAPFLAYAWVVHLGDGYVAYGDKTYGFYVWPVRGGQ